MLIKLLQQQIQACILRLRLASQLLAHQPDFLTEPPDVAEEGIDCLCVEAVALP